MREGGSEGVENKRTTKNTKGRQKNVDPFQGELVRRVLHLDPLFCVFVANVFLFKLFERSSRELDHFASFRGFVDRTH